MEVSQLFTYIIPKLAQYVKTILRYFALYQIKDFFISVISSTGSFALVILLPMTA